MLTEIEATRIIAFPEEHTHIDFLSAEGLLEGLALARKEERAKVEKCVRALKGILRLKTFENLGQHNIRHSAILLGIKKILEAIVVQFEEKP